MHSPKITISVASHHADWHVYCAKWQWENTVLLSEHLPFFPAFVVLNPQEATKHLHLVQNRFCLCLKHETPKKENPLTLSASSQLSKRALPGNRWISVISAGKAATTK